MVWMASQAAGGLRYKFPVTLLLVSLTAFALVLDLYCKRLRPNERLCYLLLPAAGIPITLLTGTLFEEQPLLSFLPVVCLVLGIVLAAVAVVGLRPAWMTSIMVSLCFLWYSYWCCFVAGMSITGDWL